MTEASVAVISNSTNNSEDKNTVVISNYCKADIIFLSGSENFKLNLTVLTIVPLIATIGSTSLLPPVFDAEFLATSHIPFNQLLNKVQVK